MKKVLTIFLLLTICLSTSAQIQRKILGFTLGSSSKTAVYNYLKKNHIKFANTEDGEYCAYNIKFAGQIWENVWFSFYNGMLYNIEFTISEFKTPIKTLDIIYSRLSLSLKNKYSYYRNSSSEDLKFDDNVIEITLLYRYTENIKSLRLMYSHIPSWNRKIISEEDEL